MEKRTSPPSDEEGDMLPFVIRYSLLQNWAKLEETHAVAY